MRSVIVRKVLALMTAASLAASLAATLAAPAAKAEEKLMNRTITVSAGGNATAVPDIARISSGVSTEAPTAREALTANTQAMTKVVDGIKAAGIDAKDVQTANFSISPMIDYSSDGKAPVTRGYRVDNAVSVTVRDIAKLGDILDQLVTLGANQAGQLSFEVSKAEELKDDARKAAMANALRRAKLLAEAGGAELGKVLQILEDTSYQGPSPVMFEARAAKMSAAPVPIERGSTELEARVTVTWELK